MESFAASILCEEADVSLLFVASPDDLSEIAELERVGAPFRIASFVRGPGDYAKKINWGARITQSDWIFTAADDLYFHPGWLSAAIGASERTGCPVVGTNDLGNKMVIRGHYATHLLIRRDYLPLAVIDKPGDLLCELYDHNCVDTELVETAKARGAFVPATDSHVEHLHHLWGKGTSDEIYVLGTKNYSKDQQLLIKRRQLWRRLRRDIPQGRLSDMERMRQMRVQQVGMMRRVPRGRG